MLQLRPKTPPELPPHLSVGGYALAQNLDHASALVFAGGDWVVRSVRYTPESHPCTGACVTASQMRIVNVLLQRIQSGRTAELLLPDLVAVEWLNHWLNGGSSLPEWYTPHRPPGSLSHLAKRLSHVSPDHLVIRQGTTEPIVGIAGKFTEATLIASNYRHATGKAALAETLQALGTHIPAA